MPVPAINLVDVCHQYYNDTASKFSLCIPQWQVKQGELVFLCGRSGSGKSTLLNILSGVLRAESGKVEIMGNDLALMNDSKRDAFRARHIGVVFQTFNLIPYLSVIKNIELAAYFAKNKITDVKRKAQQLLQSLNLDVSLLTQPIDQLSIGQQQRVAIVRAMINQPEILLVDEPTSALDCTARDAFMQVLIDTCSLMKTTLIFVSHDQSLKSYFSTVVNIDDVLFTNNTETEKSTLC